jgi:nucleoid-associated protein YgaU
MAPVKLTMTTEAGLVIPALYNPEKYSVTKSVQYAEIGIPGLNEPVLQFIRGQNEKVTLDLFFDTTGHGMVDNVVDVRTLTRNVYGLLKVDTNSHAPPRFRVEWGVSQNLSLFGQGSTASLCVMESMNEEFTLFAPTGEPLRAKLTVTIRLASSVEVQFRETPLHSPDRTNVRKVARGQRITDVAYDAYGDSTAWRAIADANPGIGNPRFLQGGATLLVPSLTGGTKSHG